MAKKENDRMSADNIKKVIEMLSPIDPDIKPWTKKEACSFLGMSYNTTKLASILEGFLEDEANTKAKYAENKGKPVDKSELVFIIQEYLDGESIDSISKLVYRSAATVKRELVQAGVTFRPAAHDYFHPELVPDAAVRTRFSIGEKVYSARYACTAEIMSEEQNEQHGWVYRVWLEGDLQQFAFTAAYDLASYEHLRELGVAI